MELGLFDGGVGEYFAEQIAEFIFIVVVVLVEYEAELLDGEVGLFLPLHNL